jgi:tetratricopeptide (TPR) repeat protein
LTLALKDDLSLTERAWAQLELAHAHLSLRQLSEAKEALERGLSVAWRAQVRAETLILRGLLELRLGNSEDSLADFSEVTQLSASRRLIVQAYIGRAFAFALRGDAREVTANAKAAFVTEATRATVSRLDPFWDLQLDAAERDCARALLLLGRAEVHQGEDPREAQAARSQACRLLQPTESRDLESTPTEETSAVPWGVEIKRSLSAFQREACSQPVPAEINESEERGNTSHERHPSASGDDEDDF